MYFLQNCANFSWLFAVTSTLNVETMTININHKFDKLVKMHCTLIKAFQLVIVIVNKKFNNTYLTLIISETFLRNFKTMLIYVKLL